MAITTLDGAIAGMQSPQDFLKVGTVASAAGIMQSFWYAAGRPGAGAAPAAGMAGEALAAPVSGQLPFSNPISGNSYLARYRAFSSIVGSMMLFDRLWQQSGIVVTTTTEQTVNSVAFPARDLNGSTNGVGVQVALEVSSTMGNGAVTTITLHYYNQDGVERLVSPAIPSFTAAAKVGSLFPFPLVAGDTGVRSVAGITLGTTLVSGSVSLIAYRPLSSVDVLLAYSGQSVDALTSGFVKLYNNSVPFIVMLPSATTAASITGQMIVTQG